MNLRNTLLSLLLFCSSFVNAELLPISSNSINACFNKIDSNYRAGCKFKMPSLLISQQENGALLSNSIQHFKRAHHNYLKGLTTSKDKIEFAIDSLVFLSKQNLIKPLLIVRQSKGHTLVSVTLRHAKNEKSGDALRLTTNEGESAELLMRLTKTNFLSNLIHLTQLQKMLAKETYK